MSKPFRQLQKDAFNRWFSFLLKMSTSQDKKNILFQVKEALWKCWLNEAEKKHQGV